MLVMAASATAPPWWPDARPLQVTATFAVAIAATIIVVQVLVLLMAAYVRYQQRRRDAFNGEWRPRMSLASIDGGSWPDAQAPRGERERLWWLMLWNRMQRQLRGDSKVRLNRMIRLLGMQKHAANTLHRRGTMRRLVALETFRHLADAAFWGDVEPHCRAGNSFVAISAAHALMAMDPVRAIRLVLRMTLERRDWSIQRLGGLCRAAGPAVVTPALLNELDPARPTNCRRLAPLLEYADPNGAAPWVRATLPRERSPGIVVPSLGVLAELGDPRDRAVIVANLGHANREVRLAAVKALRRQAGATDVELLMATLRDSSWWVRREAADTLAAMPGLGERELPQLLQRVDDAFGRDELTRAFNDRRAGAPA